MRILPFFGSVPCLFTVHWTLHTLCLFTIQMHNRIYTFCWDVQLKMAFPQSPCFPLYLCCSFLSVQTLYSSFFPYSPFTIWNINCRIQECAWTVSHAIFIFVLSYRTDGFRYGGWLYKTLFSNDLCSMSCLQKRNGIRQTKRRLTFTIQFIRCRTNTREYSRAAEMTQSVSSQFQAFYLFFLNTFFDMKYICLTIEYSVWSMNVERTICVHRLACICSLNIQMIWNGADRLWIGEVNIKCRSLSISI